MDVRGVINAGEYKRRNFSALETRLQMIAEFIKSETDETVEGTK